MERHGCLMAGTALLCCRQCMREDSGRFSCRPLRHEDEDEGEEDPVLWTEDDPSSSYYSDGADEDATHIVHRHRCCPYQDGGGEAHGSVTAGSTGVHMVRTLDEDEDEDEDEDSPDVWRGHMYPYCELRDSYGGHRPCVYAHRRSEENGCACLYKSRTDSCEGVTTEQWPYSPFPCLSVSKTLLVGVEVDIVEELEFEDTEVLEEPVE
ncbi:uncharacterized protein LOC134448767 [Engraulis encrasicolus]|uniref:uncharacterized protein LOC134448767 n=1 Tax=Engraulis encrasicolus TaxID=184585 RepID=UPI002FD1BDE3